MEDARSECNLCAIQAHAGEAKRGSEYLLGADTGSAGRSAGLFEFALELHSVALIAISPERAFFEVAFAVRASPGQWEISMRFSILQQDV